VIVRPDHDIVHVITQPEHAELAAGIIGQAVDLEAHPRRAEILLAVAEHDNGWTEEDAAPILNPATGHLADFVNVPLVVRHRVWPRAIQRLEAKSWSAALVAHHALVVYDRFRPETEWQPFFAGLTASRDRLVHKSGMSFEDLDADYRFLRLADLISLTFCMGLREKQRYSEWTVQLTGSRVVVTPDPFDGALVPIRIRARQLPNRRFQSDAELRAAVSAAAEVVLTGTVAGTADMPVG
jgi:uncharacterized protein DUF3891